AADVLQKVYGISLFDYFKWRRSHPGVLAPSYFIKSLWENDKHWIALNRTICYYDKATRKITKLPELPNVKKRDKFSPITGISIGKGEELVVIDKANSAFIFNHKENKWNEFLPEGFL